MYAQFLLFEKFDPLDVIGPYEVLQAAVDFADDDLEMRLVSVDGPGRMISGVEGLTLEASATLDPTLAGWVIVPGVAGPVEGDPDEVDTIPVMLTRLSQQPDIIDPMRVALQHPEVNVAGVCGGSLLLAMGGLLEGRTGVTHVLGLDVLEASGVTVVDTRVVDDGDFVSGGGVTSGLDVGLYLAERIYGPAIAHQVETLFQYERRGVTWRRAA